MKINLTYWPIMRLIKVAVALGCFYAYFVKGSEWFILIIGILAFSQALLNPGCGNESCEVPEDKS